MYIYSLSREDNFYNHLNLIDEINNDYMHLNRKDYLKRKYICILDEHL